MDGSHWMNVSDAWGGEYMPVRFDWILSGVVSLALGVILAALIGVPTDDARAGTELVIEDLEPRALETISFSANPQAGVTVEAVGAGLKSGEYLFAYPWIIDARTRQLVWSMAEEITDPVGGSKWLREYDDEITLRSGSYELIYYAGPPYYYFGF